MNADLTPRTQSRLSQLLIELQKEVDDSTPPGQAIQQRNSYALAWDNVMQEALKNLADMRANYQRLLHTLEDAAAYGTGDTDRVITAIQESTAVIVEEIEEIQIARKSTKHANRSASRARISLQAYRAFLKARRP